MNTTALEAQTAWPGGSAAGGGGGGRPQAAGCEGHMRVLLPGWHLESVFDPSLAHETFHKDLLTE